MTAEQYWNGETLLINSYEEAYNQAQKRKNYDTEYSAWLNGFYFNRGYVAARNKEVQYPQNLILYEERKKQEEEHCLTFAEKEMRENEKVKAYLQSKMGVINRG